MSFGSPYFLLLLIFSPLLIERELLQSISLFRQRGWEPPAAALSFSAPFALSKLRVSARTRLRTWVLTLLRLGAFLLFVLALARPQTATSYSETETSGRDIMLALDISGSMRALDFSLEGKRVNRLTALKSTVSRFVKERQGDRIGLVIFGTDVYTQCPLTSDQNILQEFIQSLEIGMVGDGTALGDGLALAIKRLRSIKEHSKVVVLVTDGVRTAGNIDPKEAAELAKSQGIKVYTIGIGGSKPAPMPVPDIFGNMRVQYMPVELDEKTLRSIASITGAKYFHAQDTTGLEQVYKEISELEERVIRRFDFVDYEEEYLPFALLGLLLFAVHEVLALTRYAVIP